MRIILRLSTLLLSLTLSLNAYAGLLKDSSASMLARLDSVLVSYQNADPRSPFHGAIYCPACGLYHTRAAEAVFPLAYEYKISGDRARLDQALALGRWLISCQEPEGMWRETPDEWTGTTTDQLLMLLLSYPLLEKQLRPAERKRWLASMERAADYLTGFIDNHNASINYCCTTAATLAEAFMRLGKAAYRLKAMSLAHMVAAKMGPEYLIEGEGARTQGYRYGVDIAYNMEMSLWGLARYAQLMDDEAVMEAVRSSTRSHMAFIFPDGMMEASIGVRSNKWTLYGGSTSDGCHPLFALLSSSHPEYVSAALRNIRRIEDCFTASGLLGTGPDYDRVFRSPPCIYATFTKAKSMAMAHMWLEEDIEAPVDIPADRDTVMYFRSLNSAVIRSGPWCATVSAYGYKSPLGTRSKNMFRPTGGVMSALWSEDYGLVQASSQTEYIRWEPLNFPELEDVLPLTPRIECQRGDTLYTNLFEYDAVFDISEDEGVTVCTVSGYLKDREQTPCDISYTICYTFDGKTLTKMYKVRGGTVSVIEPVLYYEDMTLDSPDGHTIILGNGSSAIRLVSNQALLTPDYLSAERYRQVYPALTAIPLVMTINPGAEISLEYSVLSDINN